jgi:glycosyltransferase involved in cell wall biosynthesis
VRIAQIAPLYTPVPPVGYGGTELAASQITEELVRRGHEVTLFASGDSRTSATLEASVPYALWSDEGRRTWPTPQAATAQEVLHVEAAFARAGEFDLVHNHAGYEGMSAASRSTTPVLTTHHHAFEPSAASVFAEYPWYHHALSHASSLTFPRRGQLPPIHHGIDVASYPFRERSEGYLLFVGRIVPEKGVEYAVEIARRAGRDLVIAGVVQQKAADYGERIVGMADGKRIRYVGEAGPEDKRRLMGGAAALLFPIVWDEPFGLVVIEAFACGTPVLAFANASAPELVQPGETGYLAEAGEDPMAQGAGVDRLAAATKLVGNLSRRRCRDEAEERFTVERMVDHYEEAYERVRSGSRHTSTDAVVDDHLPREARPAPVAE